MTAVGLFELGCKLALNQIINNADFFIAESPVKLRLIGVKPGGVPRDS